MPWLAATALLHCTAVMEKREALKIWTIFLAILAFSLSLIGTFLVRSGVWDVGPRLRQRSSARSLHSPYSRRLIGGSLALFAARAGGLKQGGLFCANFPRRGARHQQFAADKPVAPTVFVGTLYPLALEALTGEKISVRRAFLQSDIWAALHSIVRSDANWPVPRLETRRPFGRSAKIVICGWRRTDLYAGL